MNYLTISSLTDDSMIMKCVAYKKGMRLGDLTIEDISEALKQEDTFVWLGLREADSDLLTKIQEEFGLHELAVEDARSAHQRPKIEEYGESLFLVLHTAILGEESSISAKPIFLSAADFW